ncbi:hypothetical protein IV203_030224 [Nitzschia inconspicua]|uniref:Uncharacterized protein n=1 Tax=Nitzschia inconspicua TaxID=303405 RepID=A0A9K3LS59_9STRA|nr:hypothetical protein IV203_030224 [Nitzschia inconspicua]
MSSVVPSSSYALGAPPRNTGIEVVSGATFNNASVANPISTLEKQYAFPLGQRLVLGVQVNAACCLEGGVETILKQLKGQQQGMASVSPLNIQQPHHNSTNNVPGLAFGDREDSTTIGNGGDLDAFSFLNEEDAYARSGADTSMTASSSSSRQRQGIGGFLKKMAVNTGAQLERSMQNLAVKMDQGKNPDLVRAALYDPVTLELLDVTETRPLPSFENRSDIRFELPLIVPGARRQQNVLIKVWIQSGAALLQSTKAAKNYLLGSALVDCMKLVVPGISAVTLSSALVVGGQIQLCALPDPKFSQGLTRGWSLTDPDMSGYSSTLNHLPLDQSYIFPGKQPHHWLIANERATESTVTLPIATAIMDLAAKATERSLNHAESIAGILKENRHDYKDTEHKATCTLGVVGVVPVRVASATAATITVAWRRPDSIFELEIVANEPLPISQPNTVAGFPVVKSTFYPKLVTENVLPSILEAYGGRMPSSGFLLGGLHFCIALQTSSDQEAVVELWETVIGLESFIGNGASNGSNTIQVPLHKHKEQMGHLLMQIQLTLPQAAQQAVSPGTQMNPSTNVSSDGGLVSLVGLDSLLDGVRPCFDCPQTSNGTTSLRDQQLNTMGYFFTTQYMEQQLSLRKAAAEAFQERFSRYKQALMQPEKVPAHSLKTPKNFRPSSSRSTALLSGIPFNVHVASLNVNVMDAMHPKQVVAAEYPGASFHNVTCGAPSDHARGFGNIMPNGTNINVSGGLRRLEAKRMECAIHLQQAQSLLIAGVGNYLSDARRTGSVNHIPARHAEIQRLRWRVFECVQNLHHITWMCAVRRANVFSQSLGLAVTSYLASVSDRSKCAAGWPDLWRRHGFMVCFEGLLSAAGKELGMIEDASVAIAMLRMVRIVLMPDNGIPSKAVYVPSSPFLKWVNIFPTGEGQDRRFLVQLGVDPGFYAERVPAPLQSNNAVQLFPLLYEVGVDVRQWGAHKGANIMRNGQRNPQEQVTGGLVEDEDDDVGVVDEDVLVALNYEALRKMNCYAHAISPQDVLLDKVQNAASALFSSDAERGGNRDDSLPVHPSLSTLHAHVLSSAGKMNHSILDEAATIAQQLGGGGLVFCKSGKDRTAMHVTYKQAQFAARYRDNNDDAAILEDATLIRIHGTRLPICEKNVGQSKYAFNSLQVKFMPDALKPPMSTLAGCLKGGEIFRGGGIES